MAPKAVSRSTGVDKSSSSTRSKKGSVSSGRRLYEDLQAHSDYFDDLVNRFPASIYISRDSGKKFVTDLSSLCTRVCMTRYIACVFGHHIYIYMLTHSFCCCNLINAQRKIMRYTIKSLRKVRIRIRKRLSVGS